MQKNKIIIKCLNKKTKIHFIGIGGVSMSAIAEILSKNGYFVTGSDSSKSIFTEKLEKNGIKIIFEHKKENVKGKDLVCYTAAISKDNPEILGALEEKIPIIERCELVGEITKNYNLAVAVAGSHGKTTATAMINDILVKAKLDPTSLIGAFYSGINGNLRLGKSEFLVYEACEYVESFLKFSSKIGIITNIEADHLDYYKDLNHVISAFEKFSLIPSILIANNDDKNSEKIIKNSKKEVLTFGIKNECDFKAIDIVENEKGSSFKILNNNEILNEINLKVPGIYNIYNALAANACADYLQIDKKYIKEALEDFTGVSRRFEILGKYNEALVVDDYAHHPSEIRETLLAVKKMNFKKVWCVFESHTYTRTKLLLNEFSEALSLADSVIVTKIYAARETNDVNIFPEDLSKKIKGAIAIENFKNVIDYLKNNLKPGEIVITMGAGIVNEIGEALIKENKTN